MKALKKEIITIVVLMIFALIGTYVVNANQTPTEPVKPILVEMKNTDSDLLLAEDYSCKKSCHDKYTEGSDEYVNCIQACPK